MKITNTIETNSTPEKIFNQSQSELAKLKKLCER
jgi:hypothetical protein